MSGAEVMAHYFTASPLRLTTAAPATPGAPGYYYQNYVSPALTGEGGKHARYGGMMRDWPLQDGLAPTSEDGWELSDMILEVRQAKAVGLSGFTMDMLSIRGFDGNPDTVGHWTRVKRMLQAVETVNQQDGSKFKLLMMPDGTSGSTAWVTDQGAGSNAGTPNINASADALAQALAQLASSPAVYKIGGKMVIGPFAPEKWPSWSTGRTASDRPAFWSRVKSTLLSSFGVDSLLWFCYVDSWTGSTGAPMFDSIAYGHGRWGDRDANTVSAESSNNRGAPAYCRTNYNKPWMHFGGTPMDSRPVSAGTSGTNYRTWEGWGTRTVEGSWKAAIEGAANFNQIPTWNDYAEHAHIAPSQNHGYAMLDYQSYWITRYRTGVTPAIVRDGLYLSHRVMRTDAAVAADTAQVAFSVNGNSNTPMKNEIEVMVFATANSSLEILVDGSVVQTTSVTSGATRVNAPLPASGIISARLKRSGTVVPGTAVTSTQAVKSTVDFDDYQYRMFSSLNPI